MVLCETFDDMWALALSTLRDRGSVVQSRVGPCREVLAFQATVSDPRSIVTRRRFDPAYAAAELLWYLSWDDDGTMLQHYAPSYVRFLRPDAGGTPRAYGAYGMRWRGQVDGIVSKLRRDPGTRQTVLATWASGDAAAETPDVPCTLSLQFLVRPDETGSPVLNLIVTMRSNDVWLGMPYDVFAFSRLQKMVADMLGLQVGCYVHQVGSLHLYEKDEAQAYSAWVSEPIPSRAYYTPMTCQSLVDAAWKATSIERLMRTGRRGHADAAAAVRESALVGTELGAMVVLCATREDGKLPPSCSEVDPTMWRLLLERRKQL